MSPRSSVSSQGAKPRKRKQGPLRDEKGRFVSPKTGTNRAGGKSVVKRLEEKVKKLKKQRGKKKKSPLIRSKLKAQRKALNDLDTFGFLRGPVQYGEWVSMRAFLMKLEGDIREKEPDAIINLHPDNVLWRHLMIHPLYRMIIHRDWLYKAREDQEINIRDDYMKYKNLQKNHFVGRVKLEGMPSIYEIWTGNEGGLKDYRNPIQRAVSFLVPAVNGFMKAAEKQIKYTGEAAHYGEVEYRSTYELIGYEAIYEPPKKKRK